MKHNSHNEVMVAIKLGLVTNILLAILKLSFGFWGNAQALVSDGLNSASDILISMMILVVLKHAVKKPDYDHPYGHEKYEGLAYFVLGIIFLATSV